MYYLKDWVLSDNNCDKNNFAQKTQLCKHKLLFLINSDYFTIIYSTYITLYQCCAIVKSNYYNSYT